MFAWVRDLLSVVGNSAQAEMVSNGDGTFRCCYWIQDELGVWRLREGYDVERSKIDVKR